MCICRRGGKEKNKGGINRVNNILYGVNLIKQWGGAQFECIRTWLNRGFWLKRGGIKDSWVRGKRGLIIIGIKQVFKML